MLLSSAGEEITWPTIEQLEGAEPGVCGGVEGLRSAVQ